MRLIALTVDGLTLRNVSRLAAGMELEVAQAPAFDEVEAGDAPVGVVIDLEPEDGFNAIEQSKQQWPQALVVGVVTMPGGDLWKRAEFAGCDVVTTRGALAKVVPAKLRAWMETPGGRRQRLFAMSDIAGRLGVVHRFDDRVAGPLAAYHIGGEICVVQDICPHAGAVLSQGEVDVDNGIVTCPEHGSRFDTCTGERVRGPADDGLETFRVVIEDGQAYVQLDPG